MPWIAENPPTPDRTILLYSDVTSIPTSNLAYCRIIRTYRTPSVEYNCTIMEAALATMALPSWFPRVKSGSVYSPESPMSGSIGSSNLTKKALVEANRIFGSESRFSVIISLGPERRSQNINGATTETLRKALDEMAHSGDLVTILGGQDQLEEA